MTFKYIGSLVEGLSQIFFSSRSYERRAKCRDDPVASAAAVFPCEVTIACVPH